MAISTVEQDRLKQNPPPPADRVRERAENYMRAAGMGFRDLAYEVNYSPVAVRMFLVGRYDKLAHSSDLYIRAALDGYMDSHPVGEEDDAIPAKLIPTRDSRLILARIEEARARRLMVVIESPPGTSKTAMLKSYWADHNRRRDSNTFYLFCEQGITTHTLLQDLCRQTHANPRTTSHGLFLNLVRKLKAARARGGAVLLIDECQRLVEKGTEPLEKIRDIFEQARCGIVLAGHFSFLRNINNGLAKYLGPFKSRVDLVEQLSGIHPEELPLAERTILGRELSPAVRALYRNFSTFKDANAGHRNFFAGRKRFAFDYIDLRKITKFYERFRETRALAENREKTDEAVARATIGKLMATSRKF